jgi:hypothetical protein
MAVLSAFYAVTICWILALASCQQSNWEWLLFDASEKAVRCLSPFH